MAKLTRRVVASSSSTATIASASSPSSTTSASALSSAATTATTTHSRSPNNLKNVNNQKFAQTFDHSPKFFVDGVNGVASLRTDASVYPDPMRAFDVGEQYTTHYNYNNLAPSVANFPSKATLASTALPLPTALDSSSPPPFLANKTSTAQILAAERARIRADFFATYDVMTGVRIAATLGGFFGLMVFLIVWKSRSSSNETLKVLKDPKMAAVAAVCMQEEEERKIQEAMVATGMSIYPDEYDAILYRRQRMLSLGNVSAPPILHRGYRFSSVGGGGYSSLLEPPRRFSYSNGGKSASTLLINTVNGGGAESGAGGRRKSGSDPLRILSNYPVGNSFTADDYFMETEDEFENVDYADHGRQLLDSTADHHKRTDSTKSNTSGFLAVPHVGYDSRRSSAMTCCSTDSSYLERRCSAFTLGLGNLPTSLHRKLSTTSRTSSTGNWDYNYPDIQIIQPTPKTSPGSTQRNTGSQMQPSPSLSPPPPPTAATATKQITTTMTPKALATTSRGSKTTKTVPKPTTAANGISAANQQTPFVRKHSIAYYDPESAQAGRKQQIHSISADTVDLFPYNHGTSAATPTRVRQSAMQSFYCNDSTTEELRLSVRRKIAVAADLQRSSNAESLSPYLESNNNFFNNTAIGTVSTASTAVPQSVHVTNSSSLSIDSTPVSIDKLNGSGSLGTAKILFNAAKRAPLASLSSFKISSLEYQDSDKRSLDDDSVFAESIADTDEDMRQLSSESEEASLDEAVAAAAGVVETTETSQLPPTLPAHEKLQGYTAGETRFSAAACNQPSERLSSARARRPLLQRHRTISASSSDRVSLIGHQLKEFAATGQGQGHGIGDAAVLDAQAHTKVQLATQALETHFGTQITTNSPPAQSRRAQLLQQYSDPHSLPTTTTTNTEDETCSTLNTEVCPVTALAFDTLTSQAHCQGGSSHRCSPQSNLSGKVTCTQACRKQRLSPRSRLPDESCCVSSSLSESVALAISNDQPNINVPSSLKKLILRGCTAVQTVERPVGSGPGIAQDKSAKNPSSHLEVEIEGYATDTNCPSVMLELPLIKLPTTDDSAESSSASNDIECSRSISDESRDPSLPGSSRKWSRETLF